MAATERLSEFISEVDYLQQERLAERKHEYYQGEVTAMAGASYEHNLMVANLIRALGKRLPVGCMPLASDMRSHIPVHSLYKYPDVVVVCGKPQFLDNQFDTLLNPSLLVEVLSPSTRAYDMGEKATRYRAIGSLQYYLMVDSTAFYAALLTRTERPGQWLLTETTDPTATLPLTALGCELPLVEVYAGVEFGQAA